VPAGKPLSTRSRRTARTLEAYLANGAPPRWMERLMQVENGIKRARHELAERYELVRAEHAEDAEAFAARWHEVAAAYRFDELNAIIRAHNAYYPIERDLPMDPRTGEYRIVGGRGFTRPELGPGWVLEHFPAEPGP
jgi:hypothetical protein